MRDAIQSVVVCLLPVVSGVLPWLCDALESV